MEGLQIGCEDAVIESAEVERVVELVTKAMEGEVRKLAKSLVLKQDKDLLGPGEFELRDAMLRAASRVLEATLNDRKKGGITAAASHARSVRKMRVSSNGESSGS
jgi:hypothetical protein